MVHGSHTKNYIAMHLGQVFFLKKILVSNIFNLFLVPFHLAIWTSKVSEKFRMDRKIGFQNTFYTKCINVIIDSIGPSIILRSIDSLQLTLMLLLNAIKIAYFFQNKTFMNSCISLQSPHCGVYSMELQTKSQSPCYSPGL